VVSPFRVFQVEGEGLMGQGWCEFVKHGMDSSDPYRRTSVLGSVFDYRFCGT
jgi:hypothetical protein